MKGIGSSYAENASCPHGLGGRLVLSLMSMLHRPFWRWALRSLPAASSILDIGGGSGGALRILGSRFPRASLTLIDPSPVSISAAGRNRRIRAVQGRCEALPFDDESFDLIILLDSVYYIDITIAFPEVLRVLKPGGMVVVGFEATDPDAVPRWAADNGVVVRRPEDIAKEMEGAGIDVHLVERGQRAWARIVGVRRMC